ncbi:PAS domain-containing sensor histidine kinase [Marinibactrum halimedae]|uniref:histidine kinase n=1 Tax=Marinibactrum halimedae TaxID=1444977 RepID=A0AA37T6L2_9GAMM|nr:PAS domain-containing sensor histidine kinase [Marinibactrum halimedae]MCD9459576.1 PAS domain-containing protein [Marinibactrum halimedae]GLS25607.1 hypothetical protein GCM10007877_13210 [Marinibactrum halimedae]
MSLEHDPFFELSSELLCELSSAQEIVRLNKSWQAALGVDNQSPQATLFIRFIHPDDQARVQEVLTLLFQCVGQQRSFSARIRSAYGNYRWLECRAYADVVCSKSTVSSNSKEAIHAYLVATDVTEFIRKDSYLDKLSLATNMGFWEVDLDTKELYWSEMVHRIHETDPKTYHPRLEEGLSFYHPESIPILTEAIDRQLQTGEAYDLELRFITAKGNHRWVRTMSNSETQNGKAVRLYGSFEDITKKVEELRAVEALKERLELACEAGNIGVWDFDVPANHLIWDERMYAIYGVDAKSTEKTYSMWQTCLHPDDKDRAVNEYYLALKGEKEFSIRFRIITPGGVVRYIAAGASVFRNGNGEPIRMLGVNMDVTEEEQYKSELQQQRQLAEEMSQAKSIFISNMSHELRTPLNSIIGFSQRLLRSHQSLTGRLEESLKIINNNGHHLLQLINDILDLSKIDANKFELKKEKTNVTMIVQEVVESFAEHIEQKSLKVTTELDPFIYCMVDPLRFKQIAINLISNAIKYTEAGFVKVRLSEVSSGITLSISDSGIGIQEHDLSRLFRRFEQFDQNSESKVGHGTGLGLAITNEMVTLHGGSISVESEFGKGSCFRVYIPHTSEQATDKNL